MVRDLALPPGWDAKKDPDHVALLALETARERQSCLVFCATKATCQQSAKAMCDLSAALPERDSPIKPPPPSAAAAATAATASQPRPAAAAAAEGGGGAAAPGTPPRAAASGSQGSGRSGGGGSGEGAAPASRREELSQRLADVNAERELVEFVKKGVAYHHRGAALRLRPSSPLRVLSDTGHRPVTQRPGQSTHHKPGVWAACLGAARCPRRSARRPAGRAQRAAHAQTLTVTLTLSRTGVHAGLPSEATLLVEEAYRTGVVSVLCCTTTLAIGVNLPARRVIFKHMYSGMKTDTNKFSIAQ